MSALIEEFQFFNYSIRVDSEVSNSKIGIYRPIIQLTSAFRNLRYKNKNKPRTAVTTTQTIRALSKAEPTKLEIRSTTLVTKNYQACVNEALTPSNPALSPPRPIQPRDTTQRALCEKSVW